MLPLWILDITKQSDRRKKFQELIRQIEHVRLPQDDEDEHRKKLKTEFEKVDVDKSDGYDNTENAEGSDKSDPSEGVVETVYADEKEKTSASDASDDPVKKSKSIEELVEEEDKKKAAREAVIKGNYWYYTHLSYEDYFDEVDINDPEQTEEIAKKLYDFQEDVVKKAKDFIMELRKFGYKLEVLEPASLRETFKKDCEKMLNLYKD